MLDLLFVSQRSKIRYRQADIDSFLIIPGAYAEKHPVFP